MSYLTPELLLVGAAQNLVLDISGGTSIVQACEVDSESQVPKTSDIHELW